MTQLCAAGLLLAFCTLLDSSLLVLAETCDANTPRGETTKGVKLDEKITLNTVGTCDSGKHQDCEYCRLTTEESTTCSAWREDGDDPKGKSGPLYVSYVVGLIMAFAIGGNDSANSLATSVGSGAITLRNACIMGAVGEFLGATFLGAGVSSTIQKGVADITDPKCWGCGWCNSQMDVYQFGMLAALAGAAFFLLLVTFWSLPVSTTHAVVGGVVGMTMASIGTSCLNWSYTNGLTKIVAGWVISPLFAGGIGAIMYVITYFAIFKTPSPTQSVLRFVPVLYGLTFGLMVFLTLAKAPVTKGLFDDSQKVFISLVVVAICTVMAHRFELPPIKEAMEQMDAELRSESAEERRANYKTKASHTVQSLSTIGRLSLTSGARSLMASQTTVQLSTMHAADVDDKPSDPQKDDDPDEDGPGLVLFTQSAPNREQKVAKVAFRNLLVMTAFMKCFGHGANDTANATGLVGAVQFAHDDGRFSCVSRPTDTFIMAIAGIFVGLGVIIMGYRVIQAVGTDLADIDFHVGFCVEFSSAFAVVIATLMGLPVSTTHCQVGAIVFVAATAYGNDSVSWGMFGKIAVTWVATLPAAGFLAWALMIARFGF
jgi:sodium-dependent phosphate transporter